MNDTQLDAMLKEMGAEAVKTSESQVPSAGQVWFRAQIVRKMRRRERIERPLLVMRGIAVAICLAAALLFAFWDASEKNAAAGSSYLLPVVAVTAIAAIVAFLLVIWPAAKSNLQRR